MTSCLSMSPPIAPVLNIALVSVGTEMTVTCEIPLSLFVMRWMLIFINSNLTVDRVEGPKEGAVNVLQQPSLISTGSCLLQISIFYFWYLCIDPSSDLPISLTIPALNAEVIPTSQYSYKYSSGLLKYDRPWWFLSSWHNKHHFSWKCEHSP